MNDYLGERSSSHEAVTSLCRWRVLRFPLISQVAHLFAACLTPGDRERLGNPPAPAMTTPALRLIDAFQRLLDGKVLRGSPCSANAFSFLSPKSDPPLRTGDVAVDLRTALRELGREGISGGFMIRATWPQPAKKAAGQGRQYEWIPSAFIPQFILLDPLSMRVGLTPYVLEFYLSTHYHMSDPQAVGFNLATRFNGTMPFAISRVWDHDK